MTLYNAFSCCIHYLLWNSCDNLLPVHHVQSTLLSAMEEPPYQVCLLSTFVTPSSPCTLPPGRPLWRRQSHSYLSFDLNNPKLPFTSRIKANLNEALHDNPAYPASEYWLLMLLSPQYSLSLSLSLGELLSDPWPAFSSPLSFVLLAGWFFLQLQFKRLPDGSWRRYYRISTHWDSS